MAKMLAGAVGLVLAFSCAAFAQQAPAARQQTNPQVGQQQQSAQPQAVPQSPAGSWGPRFIDSDGDGVCDYWFGRGGGRRAANRSVTGWGQRFVDQNGDGVCDNFPGPGRAVQGPAVAGQGAGTVGRSGGGRGRRGR
jgi:hypothetical protein